MEEFRMNWKDREIQKCIDILVMENLPSENKKAVMAYLSSLSKLEVFSYW